MLFLLIGDLAVFYISLFLALFIRYKSGFNIDVWLMHNKPFIFVHILWILIFYINGLYDIKFFTTKKAIFERVGKTIIAAGFIAALMFYLVPDFKIAPKTNLLIDVLIVAVLLSLWRRIFLLAAANSSKTAVLFYGFNKETAELINYIKRNPQIGYEAAALSVPEHQKISKEFLEFYEKNKEIEIFELKNELSEIVKHKNINIAVFLEDAVEENSAVSYFYNILPLGIIITNFPAFYELIMEKIPVSIINEHWFLENLNEQNKKTNEFFKRIFDIFLAFLLFLAASPIIIITALITKITRGEVFYNQKRLGKNSKIFNLIKFGSMVLDAEKDGAKWSSKNDPRITKFGRFIRKTRIDELPQLWNILKGEMSFIGPRPERPEFVEELEKQIPHYLMRHLVKPGLSGWAQIKFPYGASVSDAMQKLQYDLYYIKNRSILFDVAISLKTLAIIARGEGV